jgi:type I restriction enzyme S subunit
MNSGELNFKRVKSVTGRITEAGYNNSATTMIPANSILIGLAGQGKTRGTAAINYFSLCTNQSIAAIFPNYDIFYPEYLYQNLDNRYDELREISSGDGTRGGLTLSLIRNLKVILPPLPEQQAIAEILSGMDGYIDSLEKLIAKKKAIKQGAMQELLTGKRRLPGFSGEWVEKSLNEALDVGHGQSQKKIEKAGGKYPVLGTGGEMGRTDYFLYDKPSVLIGRKGTIDSPQYIDTPFWTIDTLFYTIIRDDYSAKYLYYVFCMIDWNKYNEASGVPSLSSKTIGEIKITLPYYTEQSAIAAVLSDMDTEIESLTAKLNKAKSIKQGMMQELLTGRIRIGMPGINSHKGTKAQR